MPPKVRELVRQLEQAGFTDRGKVSSVDCPVGRASAPPDIHGPRQVAESARTSYRGGGRTSGSACGEKRHFSEKIRGVVMSDAPARRGSTISACSLL